MTDEIVASLEKLEKDLTEKVGDHAVELEKIRASALASQSLLESSQNEHWRLTTVLRQVQGAITEARGGVK